MQGWQALGEMMTGQVGTPGSYQKGLREGYTTEKALQDARRAQVQAAIDMHRLRAREGITGEALGELGYGPEGAVLANILNANTTVNMRNLGEFQRPGYVQAAEQAQSILGDTPDVPAANRAMAFMDGDQYEPYSLGAGGKAVFRGDTGEAEMTELGDVAVAAQSALADRRRQAPAPRAQRAPSAAASEAAELAQAREAVQAGADPAAVAELLRSRGFPQLAKKIYEPAQ